MKWKITGGSFPRAGEGLECVGCGGEIARGAEYLKARLESSRRDGASFDPNADVPLTRHVAICMDCHQRGGFYYHVVIDLP